jgi:hypothetical protein
MNGPLRFHGGLSPIRSVYLTSAESVSPGCAAATAGLQNCLSGLPKNIFRTTCYRLIKDIIMRSIAGGGHVGLQVPQQPMECVHVRLQEKAGADAVHIAAAARYVSDLPVLWTPEN